MKKHNIDAEAWREYVYPDGSFYRVESPVDLYIADSGGHRIVDEEGITHCPSAKWIAIRWSGDVLF